MTTAADCLAFTGAEVWPLVVVAAVLVSVGAGLLLLRKKTRAAAGTALLLLVLAGVVVPATVTKPAAAATGSDCVPAAATTTSPTPGAPSPTAAPTAPPVVPTPTASPTPPAPAPAAYGITIPTPSLVEYPPGRDSTQFVTTRLANASAGTSTDTVRVSVADQPDGYWTVTGVVDSSGAPYAGITIAAGAGATELVFSEPPVAGSTLEFRLVLTYHWGTWPGDPVEQPDGSTVQITRPDSTLSLTVDPSQADPDAASASVDLPGTAIQTPAP